MAKLPNIRHASFQLRRGVEEDTTLRVRLLPSFNDVSPETGVAVVDTPLEVIGRKSPNLYSTIGESAHTKTPRPDYQPHYVFTLDGFVEKP